MVQLGSKDQEETLAKRYAAQGAKRSAPLERGVWVDLARFDYHFIDQRDSQDTIGLMSEGDSVAIRSLSNRPWRRPGGLVSRLFVILLSLFGSTPVVEGKVSLISPLQALSIATFKQLPTLL